MSTTVHVSGIYATTTEKELRDFFSFCGKITSLSIAPTSEASDATKDAHISFEKETAAKTALLLNGSQVGPSVISVTTGSSTAPTSTAAFTAGATHDEHEISQEDKPRSRIVAEYLAHGYTLSDQVIQQAIALDNKHGFSNRFTAALSQFDSKYKATDKAKSVDASYGVTDKALGALSGFNSYFEKALGTPTGQRVRDFYAQTNKQVLDIHNEARRLADLKGGKTAPYQPEHTPGTNKTVCKCGGAEGVCGCAPGECACATCGKSDAAAVTEFKEAKEASDMYTSGTAATSAPTGYKD